MLVPCSCAARDVACNRHETRYFFGLSSYIILQGARAGKKCNRLRRIVLRLSIEGTYPLSNYNESRQRMRFARAVISFWRRVRRRVFSKNPWRRDPEESRDCSGNCPGRTGRCGGRCVREKTAWGSRRYLSTG